MGEVEGDWKNFVFQLAKESDGPEICQHVRDCFLRGEPMNKYLGWSEDNARDHDKMIQLALTHGLSFVIREKSTRALAGVNLVMDGRLASFSSIFSNETPMSPHLTRILTFIGKLEKASEKAMQEHFPCDFHAEIFITSVNPAYCGQGIAKEAYVRMITFLKSKGFPMVRSGFSSPVTRAIARKLGFTELGRLYYKDQLDAEGNKHFQAAGDGEDEFASEGARFI